ncbi:hypothetical protein M9H77_26760 [Catharanthus roseus]|uniref:Uncharacterized protein n=1 Tax=Catharanthus roseus TaxID=4058 RepID=A0ACC0AC01_CATRO|nr:hypothetical protein M9H77_26760 [Catharanthus roseus]
MSRSENVEEGGSSRERGKGKRVPVGVRAPDRFISVREATNFEEWTRKRRKIAPGHRVDLNDMEGIEIIPNLFNHFCWVSLFTVDELYYPEIIYEFYANIHKGRADNVGNIIHQWVLSRIGGRDIAFDDRLLNNILETPQDGIRFYTKNRKFFDPYLYSERRFEEIFTKGEVLKRHDDRNVNKLDAYKRLLHHMISNIIIPNVDISHPSRICMLSNHIGLGNIYNKHTFTRMSFEKNDEGQFVRGSQDASDEDDDDDEENEEQEGMNVDEEESGIEPEHIFRGAYLSKLSFKPLACFQTYKGSYLSLMVFDMLCP